MFALKFKHWGYKGNELKYCFVLFSVVALVASILLGVETGNSRLCYSGFSLIIVVYVLLSIIADTKKVS